MHTRVLPLVIVCRLLERVECINGEILGVFLRIFTLRHSDAEACMPITQYYMYRHSAHAYKSGQSRCGGQACVHTHDTQHALHDVTHAKNDQHNCPDGSLVGTCTSSSALQGKSPASAFEILFLRERAINGNVH